MARISKAEQAKIRDRIIVVAKDKFQTIGYDETSTKNIAKEVGIAEGTLFNYFESKNDLFLEIFSDEFITVSEVDEHDLMMTDNVTEMLVGHIEKAVRVMMKLPRVILGEPAYASIKMAKKNPKRFRRFIDLDFHYIKQLELFLDKLVDNRIILEVDTKELSELLYSVFMFEFIMYAYDHNLEKEDMMKNAKTKIEILMKGYIQGGIR